MEDFDKNLRKTIVFCAFCELLFESFNAVFPRVSQGLLAYKTAIENSYSAFQ